MPVRNPAPVVAQPQPAAPRAPLWLSRILRLSSTAVSGGKFGAAWGAKSIWLSLPPVPDDRRPMRRPYLANGTRARSLQMANVSQGGAS
jgi:hypothetical protein